ncbi:cuticle protein 8-like [Uloborus diversus]|uniref:cuticle protein 8-like n=1 Tax=Uloborus diversus TaxID=327109 RepID=UPI002409D031|nr:cuticle protein 8-like [Uloborus diversus]
MFYKVAILFATLVAVQATALLHGVALVNTGASASSRSQDAHGNYAFGYDIVDGKGASNSRSEVGDAHGNKKGSYTLHDIDGRARRVDYVADAHGFRAAVKTNEPGTALSAPAAALVASPLRRPCCPSSSPRCCCPSSGTSSCRSSLCYSCQSCGTSSHCPCWTRTCLQQYSQYPWAWTSFAIWIGLQWISLRKRTWIWAFKRNSLKYCNLYFQSI